MLETLKLLNYQHRVRKHFLPDSTTFDKLNEYIDYYKNVFEFDAMSKFTLSTIDENIFKKGVFYIGVDEIQDKINNITNTLQDFSTRLSNKIEKSSNFVTIKYTEKFGYNLYLTKKRSDLLKTKIKGKILVVGDYKFSSKSFQYKYTTSGCRMSSDIIDNLSDKLISLLNKLKVICVEKYNTVIENILSCYQGIFQN